MMTSKTKIAKRGWFVLVCDVIMLKAYWPIMIVFCVDVLIGLNIISICISSAVSVLVKRGVNG